MKSQRSLTAAALVEEAEEAKEENGPDEKDERMGDGMEEDGRHTPEIVMTGTPDPVKESPKPKHKAEAETEVIPKMR